MTNLDSCSIEMISIENYKIQISIPDFMYIQVYLCRVSFLTTLYIYKDYFKAVTQGIRAPLHALCDQRQKLT